MAIINDFYHEKLLFSPNEIERRINSLKEKLAAQKIDYAIILQNADIFYFTGNIQQGVVIISAAGKDVFLVKKNFEFAKNCSSFPEIIPIKSQKEIKNFLDFNKVVGFESDVLPYNVLNFYSKLIQPSKIVDVSNILRQVRAIKSEPEINNIKNLSLEREKVNPDFWIDMSIVTMKPNLEDLPNFLYLASNLGVNSVSVTPKYLSFSEMDFKNYYIEPDLILEKLNEVQKSLNLQNLEVRTYALEYFPKDDCLAEAVSTVFISFKGDVSACCNLGHPAPRFDVKNKTLLEPYTIYGNLEDKDLEEIWESSDFLDLRRNLKKGTVPFPCRGCALAPRKNG